MSGAFRGSVIRTPSGAWRATVSGERCLAVTECASQPEALAALPKLHQFLVDPGPDVRGPAADRREVSP